MDRDSMFGLTEEDYGYDDDDEAFEQYGLFTSASMFSGAGYRGYSGADVVTKPSMAAAAGMGSSAVAGADNGESAGYLSPDMALEQAVMALEEESWAAEELAGAKIVGVGDTPAGMRGAAGAGAAASAAGMGAEAFGSREAAGMSEEDYWGDEDEQALLFGFGEF